MQIYTNYFGKQIYKHVENDLTSVLSILQDQYTHSVSENGGQILHPLLDNLKTNDHIINSYLYDYNDSLLYSPETDSLSMVVGEVAKMDDIAETIILQSFISQPIPFMRAYIKLENSPKCMNCHTSSAKYLGMLVFDISVAETNKNIILTRNFSIAYSAVIVIFMLVSILLVHYRFVKKSLTNFHYTINMINEGNLGERLSIPESRELGELGKSFNTMVLTFQESQKELQEFHQKELKNKIKMANIGEMAARMAHEIRNPLTGIANAIEVIVKQMPDNQNKPVLEEIRHQAKRVNTAISNMLKFARSSEIKKVNSDINTIIRALIFFIKNQTNQKTIEFKEELQENMPMFPFDPDQIEGVLLNLGLNAIQSIHETGTVTFKTNHNPQDKKVLITVEDTGAGINEQEVDKIFDPFYTTKTEGSGLGLAIAKDIVEKHKGRIWAESQGFNGTKFFLYLPIE